MTDYPPRQTAGEMKENNMGEISEIMLDGTLCEGCGEYLDVECDYPRLCSDCANERRSIGHKVDRNGDFFIDCGMQAKSPVTKVQCPICKKKVKASGLSNHAKDVHKATTHETPLAKLPEKRE